MAQVIGRTFAVVTALMSSRRRAGFQFGLEPVLLDIDEVGEEQITLIAQDPMLKVALATDEQLEAFLAEASAIPVVAPHDPIIFADLPEHGFEMRYQGQSVSIALSGDPVEDCTTFFDEVALFAEKTGLAEAAQRSQPADEVAADPVADVANNQENASATDVKAAHTAKTPKAKGGGAKG